MVMSWQVKVDKSYVHLSTPSMADHIKVQVLGCFARVNFRRFFVSPDISVERHLGISNGWVFVEPVCPYPNQTG